jgi:DNA-binding GntR family transcriptional regulator
MAFQSKSDVVVAALRESIITGELPAGTPLRQRDLAARFGMSPIPVREALRRLEAEGLVESDLHRGSTVKGALAVTGTENYEIRAGLESLAARYAATRITESELDRLAETNTALAECDAEDSAAAELNRRFHFQIYEASGSPVLLALLRLLWGTFPSPGGPMRGRPLAESVRQHADILEALRRGDAAASEELVRSHILAALDYLPGTSDGKNGSSDPATDAQLSQR